MAVNNDWIICLEMWNKQELLYWIILQLYTDVFGLVSLSWLLLLQWLGDDNL